VPQETQAQTHSNGTQANDSIDNPQPTQNASIQQEVPPRKRPRTRAAPVSRFKAFDDEFDMDAVAPYEPPEESVESQMYPSQDTAATPLSIEEQPSQVNGHTGRGGKRTRSPADDDMVDGLLPAAAAMKKRKLEIDRENNRRGVPVNQNPSDERVKAKTRKAPPKKEMDVRKVARERREAEEEAAKKDQEALDANLGDLSVEEMKHLAVVVEMEVPTRNERAARANGSASDRWDEKWNGRKNFKKFRRKGEGDAGPRRQTQNVIVPLVEVKRKNYGIGDAYWSSSRDKVNESGPKSGRSGAVSSQTQTQTQSQTQPLTEETPSPTMTRLQQEAAEIVGAIDVERPRHTRLADKTQQSQQTMNSTRGKRSAPSTASGPAKKQRTIRTKAASESESDEELRFKFGSRKR
jgi:hypothetical protein